MIPPRSLSLLGLSFIATSTSAFGFQVSLVEIQKLEPVNPVGNDKYGEWLAMDGDRMLIGSPEGATTGPGHVSSYSLSGSSWTFEQKFSFLVGGPGSGFGKRLAMDDSTAVIANLGSAFIYVWNGSAWVLQRWIAAPGNNLFYGAAVGIDQDTALIGQPSMTENQVWVWRRTGSTWSRSPAT